MRRQEAREAAFAGQADNEEFTAEDFGAQAFSKVHLSASVMENRSLEGVLAGDLWPDETSLSKEIETLEAQITCRAL